jgi:anaerobic selenocysteine-containing dehydrogenase
MSPHLLLQLSLSPQEHDEVEGVVTEKWIATSCLNCPTRCATEVRVVNGKAVRIAGNPLSKVSEGENCPRSHIGLQVLYDPDRVRGPLKRTNPRKGKSVDPKWTPISWDQALTEVSDNLKALREKGQAQKLLLFYGLNSSSSEDLIKRLASSYGTPNLVSQDSLEDEASKAGEWMADGNYTNSAYDLENTNYILAFGAGIVESQKPLARNLRMWGKIRQERPNRAKIVVIDPRYSVTAAKADQWIPIYPGADAALAMALANVIITEQLYDFEFIQKWTEGFDDYKKLVMSEYSPEKVSEITGVTVDTIRNMAREFAQYKPSIAWRGRGATCWPNGSYASYAIFCLNALVGSIDVPGGVIYQEYPEYRNMPELTIDSVAEKGNAEKRLDLSGDKQFPAASVVSNQVADSILRDNPYSVEMAIGFNSNLNMSAPGTSRWDDAMEKIPYYVHIAPSITEMAKFADIILPASTFMEEWAYDHCPPGSGFTELKIKQPVVEKEHNTKSVGDIVFQLADRLEGTVAQSFARIGSDSKGFTQYRTESLIDWDEFLEKGVYVGPAYTFRKYDRIFNTPSKKFEFWSGNLKNKLEEVGESSGGNVCLPHYETVGFLGDREEYPLVFITYHPLLNIENGNQNYPWAQEIFLVMHGYGWTNFVEINSGTAKKMGIKDGDNVWVESPFKKIKVKARVFEGIHPFVVAVANGEGHTAGGRWAEGIGVNPNDIIGVDYDDISGQSAYFNTRVKVYKA